MSNKKKPAGNFVGIVKIDQFGQNGHFKKYFLILLHGNLFINFIIIITTANSCIRSLMSLINALYFIVFYIL